MAEWKSLFNGDFQPELPARNPTFDPFQKCGVYNTVGCVHIDGPLCDERCELLNEYEQNNFIKNKPRKSCGNCGKCKCDKPGGSTYL